jgi:outer membrane receptor protein involved in Fe transport
MHRSPWPTVLLSVALLVVVAAGASAMATTGVLSGQVLDTKTGEPLAGVNISLKNTTLTTVSDARGAYLITNIPPGSYDVVASLVGYIEIINTGVVITQDQMTTLDVGLEPTVLEVPGAEAKVTAARLQVRPAVTATSYAATPQDEQHVRGQPNDLYQFPGIVFGQPGVIPDSTGYPHVRGARDDQVGYMLEGIPIVEPSNNVFATNIVTVGLDRMELYTGGYPASYPGFVGGVINEVIKRGDQVRGGMVDTSLGSPWNYRDFILEAGRVDQRWNWYYQSNIWRSDFHDNNFVKAADDSSDAIAKAIYTVGEKDNLTLLANHGYARYLFPFEHTQTFDPKTGLFVPLPASEQDFGRQGYNLDAITWSHSLSPKSFYTLRGYRLDNWLRIDLSSDQQGFWQDRAQTMSGLQLNYTGEVAPRHLLYAGVWHIWGDNDQLAAGFMPPIFPPVLEYSASNNTRNLQAYVGDRWRALPKLTLDVGVRQDAMHYHRAPHPDLDLSHTSPRVGATYALNDGVLLRASWGKYAQMPPAKYVRWTFIDRGLTPTIPDGPFDGMTQGELWPLFFAETSDLKPQIDTAYDVGVEARLGPQILLTTTYFNRSSRHMTQRWNGVSDSVLNFDDPTRFASNGHGHAHGVELKLQRPLAKNWEGWLSYTYMKARATSPQPNAYPLGIDFGDLDAEYYVPWDQRHTAVMAVNHKLGRFEINPWVSYGSGFAYGQSGIDLGGPDFQYVTFFTDAGEPFDVPILVNGQLQPNAPNSLRTGSHWLFSLNLTYHATKDQDFYVGLYNLFGTHTATNLAWYDENTLEILPGAYQPPATGTPGPGNTGSITYVPYTFNPPFFAVFGIRQRF